MIHNFSTVAMGSLGNKIGIFGDADPMGVLSFFTGAYRGLETVRAGIVVTYNPNTHSAAVQPLGVQNGMWSCVFADEPLSYAYGFSSSFPAKEGEIVLMTEIAPDSQCGIIIGRVPYALCYDNVNGDLYYDPEGYHRRSFTQMDDTWDLRINGMKKPMQSEDDFSTQIASHFRPTDVYPGEFAHLNQHNCGIRGGMFSSTLIGGGASLRMSALTNSARLSCEAYRRISMHGNLHEYHNGRFLSSDRELALYQEERLGGRSPEDSVWNISSDYGPEAPTGGEDQTLRPRIKELTGFWGNLSSKFVLRPDPNPPSGERIRVQGQEPKEEGVCRETKDPSGQYRLSASGMIAIERTGRIPVPVRTCYPTDSEHDIPGELGRLALSPFMHDEQDPSLRQLELFDRQAYDLKNQYARVDGQNISSPDYYVPEEEDLKPLEDQYDPEFTKSTTVELRKYDRRRAGMFIGEDGSVIIRDAWGSEIVMVGGNITLACAGNVKILPGKTALTIAGDDIVQKAQNSIDIHASKHDVRLSAARNMEIVGGGDDNEYSGGVVIESKGKGSGPWDGESKGEQARVSGITLRTNDQGVVVYGSQVVVRSKKDTRIVSGEEEIDGNVSIAAKNIRTKSSGATVMSAKNAGMYISDGGATMVGRNVNVLGESSLVLERGGKFPVPIKWFDIGPIAAMVNPILAKATEDLAKEETASLNYNLENLSKMVFRFRSSEECNTASPWTIGGPSPFRLYEPAWVQVKSMYDTLQGIDTKTYEEPAQWDSGKPFPGEEIEDEALYVQLNGLSPANLTGEGFNKPRKGDGLKDHSDIQEKQLKGNYIIRGG